MPPHPPSPPTCVTQLPIDILVHISDYLPAQTLHALALSTSFFYALSLRQLWPRRLARKLGIRAIQSTPPETNLPRSTVSYVPPHSKGWLRLCSTLPDSPSEALSLCVKLSDTDTVSSLALKFSVTRQDIFRVNALYSERQVASRTHLYIPMLSDDAILSYTGVEKRCHVPFLVKDTVLSKYFLVVKFLSSDPPICAPRDSQTKKETYVRQLIVKLIAKGLSVGEHEVRFYLDLTHFDVAKAYKAMLVDHSFSP